MSNTDVDLELTSKIISSPMIMCNHCWTNIAEIFQVVNSVYTVGRREPILIFRAYSLTDSTFLILIREIITKWIPIFVLL
jgi:hypothetical protein